MRFLAYIGTSILLSVLVIFLAFVERPNFYSACLAISQSSASVLTLLNMAMIVVLLLGKAFKHVFFGQLRVLELEHLYERAWYAVTETFLAMTIFKDEFTLQFGLFFTILTFLRVFHWIAADRVDLIFQVATPPDLRAKIRLGAALLTLLLADLVNCYYCISEVLSSDPGIMIMFSFEFSLLTNSIATSIGKYILNLMEARYLDQNEDEDSWEQKGTWMFFIKVTSDITRLGTYIAFFIVMLKPNGLPLHIIRDVYMTSVSLFGRIRDFARFRRARAQMDERIANATAEDLTHDNVCIICREEMVVGELAPHSLRYVPKRLQCGHIIHHGCLKGWLERSQSCPTCRRPVLDDSTGPTGSWSRRTDARGGRAPDRTGQDRNQASRGDQARPNTNIFNGQNGAQVSGGSRSTGTSSTSDPGLSIAEIGQHEANNPAGHVVVNSAFKLPPGWKTFKAQKIDGKFYIQLNAQTRIPVEFESEAGEIVAEPPEANPESNGVDEQQQPINSQIG
jgi:E3 ubiquitin-protein ligase synoviolin